jgi:ERF superfamily
MSAAISEIPTTTPVLRQPITPMEMMDRAIAGGAGVEVLERLMALQERHQTSEALKAFNLSVAAAKREIPVISKNRKVDYTGKTGVRTAYDHEDLGEIARTVDPILSRYGLSYRFRTTVAEGGLITVTCVLSHEQGHSEENSLSAGRDESGNKNNIQAVGSTQTYLQRYTLKASLGLAAAKDDDARMAEPPAFVTEGKAEELRDLVQKSGTAIDAFLQHYGADSLSDFPASKFGEAQGLLKTKIRKLSETPVNV